MKIKTDITDKWFPTFLVPPKDIKFFTIFLLHIFLRPLPFLSHSSATLFYVQS